LTAFFSESSSRATRVACCTGIRVGLWTKSGFNESQVWFLPESIQDLITGNFAAADETRGEFGMVYTLKGYLGLFLHLTAIQNYGEKKSTRQSFFMHVHLSQFQVHSCGFRIWRL